MSVIYSQIEGGKSLSAPPRSGAEALVFDEIAGAREALQKAVDSWLPQDEIKIAVGSPKGSWAHVYYVSFHHKDYTTGSTDGIYPVFLLASDFTYYWLSVMISAASVGVSGRGGWSQRRGTMLKERARLSGTGLSAPSPWLLGPVALGQGGAFIHMREGQDQATSRAYECGTIISQRLESQRMPENLDRTLIEAFDFQRLVLETEARFAEVILPPLGPEETRERASAILLGKAAEESFANWCRQNRPEWGSPVDVTGRVGLGYDFHFPSAGLYAEVKGFKDDVSDIRVTETEWAAAENLGSAYMLCLVSKADVGNSANVQVIQNPFAALRTSARRRVVTQVEFGIRRQALIEALRTDADTAG